ncbi:Pex5p KNAG_0A04120 [Huiozyma naganishii CBS 8797]|uniref:Uncharacterized protein n=1 Tax=Huiozyma naganishii (strain ATCC MYA-139 / BCRC 22969 / CBS 8797 / KCTC 17520 / NBRC 10181 / NCYC 3082 / Yp74L-3) TaxID=1071383 RepID=J7S3N9_HUIN7|nr:hypothetical protein KNAG_0A04120 [Kazachstania naganishii CBS 8797]CCK68091.1 hypothetical protein KNAG_0A04120 [Kazachstania naganishii CBS 8797]
MNATSCSVNNNPLAQISKHTQDNGGFVGGRPLGNVGSSTSLESDQFRTKHNAVSEQNRHQMNHFMNNTGFTSPPASLQMGQQPALQSWSSSQVPTMQSLGHHHLTQQQQQQHHRSAMPMSPSSTNLQMRQNDWSEEFQLHNDNCNASSVSISMSQLQQLRSPDGTVGNMTPMHFQPRGYTRYNNSSNAAVINAHQRQAAAPLEQQADWDEQFDELEKEVTESLHIDEKSAEKQNEVQKEEVTVDADYQSEFQHVWDSIHQDGEDVMPNHLNGQTYFNSRQLGNIKYDFENSKNEYLNNPNAYEIGCILMENGAKLSEAAMAFEAAVQEKEQHIDAWLKLGLVQIQNEKEINGISALENCLKLDPNNLDAMKNLAISYINEGYDASAFTILNKWIETKYSTIDTSSPEIITDGHKLVESEMEDPLSLSEKITKRFLKLANQLPVVDSDVQLCLGLLFYANDDFNKTIDCFKTALQVNPNDELMWNRLGAALANSNRSEESIKAYHRALQLKPSFVRARYNLAVSSMNIGCYKEAVEHLLTALSMHEVEGLRQKDKDSHHYSNYNNDNILETLKRAFIAMNRNDLLQKVMPGMDLNEFHSEFNF